MATRYKTEHLRKYVYINFVHWFRCEDKAPEDLELIQKPSPIYCSLTFDDELVIPVAHSNLTK